MELDNLGAFVEPGRLLGEMHHQHRTDGEVRGDQDTDVSALGQLTTYEVVCLIGEPGGSDHRVNPVVDAPGEVFHHRIGMGEVDGHVHAVSRRPIVTEVQGGNQLQASGHYHRPAHFGAHPPTGPEHSDLHVWGHDIPTSPPGPRVLSLPQGKPTLLGVGCSRVVSPRT